jgi:hypothetical protein
MNKYILKPEFEKAEIITKNREGRDVLVTAETFNDYFAELMINNNQTHLVSINRLYDEKDDNQKKTFTQISEGVILLTSLPDQTEEQQPKVTVNEQELKARRGRPAKVKE